MAFWSVMRLWKTYGCNLYSNWRVSNRDSWVWFFLIIFVRRRELCALLLLQIRISIKKEEENSPLLAHSIQWKLAIACVLFPNRCISISAVTCVRALTQSQGHQFILLSIKFQLFSFVRRIWTEFNRFCSLNANKCRTRRRFESRKIEKKEWNWKGLDLFDATSCIVYTKLSAVLWTKKFMLHKPFLPCLLYSH